MILGEKPWIRTSAPTRTKTRKLHCHVSTTWFCLTKKTLSRVACADIDHCVSHYANSTVTLFTIALNTLLIVARYNN